jgi:hypothetical protein
MAAFTCDNCGKRTSGAPKVTATGRKLCPRCNDQLLGLATGMFATGNDPAGSLAVSGWFSRLRERRRHRKPPPEDTKR